MNKALWHIDEFSSELKKVEKTASQGILVKSEYSLISTGTERLVATKNVPTNLHQQMKVPYMAGTFELPIKYGYSVVGTVVSEGDFFGKKVHIMYPHQSICEVAETEFFVLPDDLSLAKATLISNMETVINAIWDSELGENEKVLIAGFGNIGGLLAETIRHYSGIDLVIFEKDDWRRAQAESFGFKTTTNPTPDYFNISFDTTSSSGGLQTCIESVGEEGKIVNLSWYGNKLVEINLGGSFHYDRKKIISSQVSKIPFSKRKDWDYLKRKQFAIELLQKHPYEQFITKEIPFEESPDFYNKLRQNQQGNGLIWVLKYL